MMLNMTKGKPLPLILRYYIPLAATSFFQILYHFADTVIVGKFVGTGAMAAVGSTTPINFFFVGFLNGVAAGFCIPAARHFGADDHPSLKQDFANILILSVVISALMTGLTLFFLDDFLRLMSTPAELFEDCRIYLIWMFAGIITIMMYNTLSGVLRSVGDSRTPFVCLVLTSIINVILNVILVIPFGLGVAGVGIATVISQGFSALYCLAVLYKKCRFLIPERGEWHYNRETSGELLKNGIPMGFQMSITAIGSLALQSAINRQGPDAVAAVSAATRIRQFAYLTMNAMGTTGSTYCSQNLGAKRMDRILDWMKWMFLADIGICAVNALVILLFGPFLLNMFFREPDPVIMEMALRLLHIGMALYLFLAMIYLFRSCIQGLGYASLTMICGLQELIARFIASFYLVEAFGYTGICLADPLAWIMADLVAVPAFFLVLKKVQRKLSEAA